MVMRAYRRERQKRLWKGGILNLDREIGEEHSGSGVEGLEPGHCAPSDKRLVGAVRAKALHTGLGGGTDLTLPG